MILSPWKELFSSASLLSFLVLNSVSSISLTLIFLLNRSSMSLMPSRDKDAGPHDENIDRLSPPRFQHRERRLKAVFTFVVFSIAFRAPVTPRDFAIILLSSVKKGDFLSAWKYFRFATFLLVRMPIFSKLSSSLLTPEGFFLSSVAISLT